VTLTNVLIYILLVLGIGLVVLGVSVVAVQLLRWDMKRTAAGAPSPYLYALVIVIGIASLGTSGFLSLKKPASSAAAQPQPTASAASTPTGSATPALTPSASSSAATTGAATGAVTLSAPSPGTNVQGCDVFTGTASLPTGETVVLGVRNLSDAGHTTYLAPVSNWDKPAALANWTGIQYFGSGDASVGQTYVVSVIVMASSTVKSAEANPANKASWAMTSLPGGASVKQTLHLTRVPGQGPSACH
jgi:hypothetical protein